jgi:hypothetical protein
LLSFLIMAFLVLILTPLFILMTVLLQSDFFLDLPNSVMSQYIFNFTTSPDDLMSVLQRYLTPAIGALIPALYLNRRGTSGMPLGIIGISALAVIGFTMALLLSSALAMDALKDRLFVENAFALDPASAEMQEAFTAKLTTARSYLSRLQESLLFIVMTVFGVRIAGR